jgi:hypothetical protein
MSAVATAGRVRNDGLAADYSDSPLSCGWPMGTAFLWPVILIFVFGVRT